MKKYISILALSALVFSGCEHDLNYNMVDDSLGFAKNEIIKPVRTLDEGCSIAVIKSGKGLSAADVSVNVDVQALIDYNIANNTNYVVLEPAFYTIKSKKLHFEAGDRQQFIEISWTKDAVVNKVKIANAAIPLVITSNDLDVDENRDFLIVTPTLPILSFEKDIFASILPDKDLKGTQTYKGKVLLDQTMPDDVTVNLLLETDGAALYTEYQKENTPDQVGNFINTASDILTLESSQITIKAGTLSADFTVTLDGSKLFVGDDPKYDLDMAFTLSIASYNPTVIKQGTKICYGAIFNSALAGGPITPPSTPQSDIMGGWTVLEGAENTRSADPDCDWATPGDGTYDVANLCDGNLTTEWVTSYNGVTFPYTIVFDTGASYIFGGFYKVDGQSYQGNYRKFEIYVSNFYDGEKTRWNLAAKGTTDYNWQSSGSPMSAFTYEIPADKKAADSEFNYTKGRYIKLVIVDCSHSYVSPDIETAGFLREFYATGWAM